MSLQFYQFKSTTFTTRQTVFAGICLLAGYFISSYIPVFLHPMAGFLGLLVLLAITLGCLIVQKHKLILPCWIGILFFFVLSAAVILSENTLIITLAFLLAIATLCYIVSSAKGCRTETGFSDYLYLDLIRSLIIPFSTMTAIFDALFGKLSGKGFRYLGKIALGAAIAVIPTIIVFANLSYDDGFRTMLNDLFDIDAQQVIEWLSKLCLGTFVGMYLFGLLIPNLNQPELLTAEKNKQAFAKLRILPQITALSAAIPILFLYVVFFISQWQYYISGFTGVLPEDFSYATYAREGFFQLCTVSAINLVIIIAISLMIRRGQTNRAPVLKILTCVFCLFTLVLIATAVAKLIMYIDFYGLTQKRFYAMWAIAVITLVFLVIALGQFIRRLKTVAISMCIVGILFGFLCVCNVNAITAQYNVDRYLSGSLESIDPDAMEDLGASAIPPLVELLENTTIVQGPVAWDVRNEIRNYLTEYADKYQEESPGFMDLRIVDYQAIDALKEYGFIE